MTLIQAIILGIVQGLAEFIPVSSSGHLLLLERVFKLPGDNMVFNIAAHLGTLTSVLFVYWKDVLALIMKPFQKYVGQLIVATVPVVLLTLLLHNYLDAINNPQPFVLALSFLITGVALLYSDAVRGGRKTSGQISWLDALLVGLAQAIGIAPGISRSGATISASVARGIKREDAAKFSFLMSVIAIVGAAVLEVGKSIKDPAAALAGVDWACVVAGFAVSALVGFFAVAFMIRLIKKGSLSGFAYYVFAVAVFIMFDTFVLKGQISGK